MTGPLRALSLGAGVQSSTLLLMAVEGELPTFDVAIFADTGAEPAEVYRWLAEVLEPRAAEAGIDLVTVHAYPDRDLTSMPWEMPLFITSPAGDVGQLKRSCTTRLKVDPIKRELRRRIADPPPAGAVEQSFGISLDEVGRMRDSDRRYITNAYPLVDRRMTRGDCQAWLRRRGLAAPRSSCVCCPYHSGAEWLRVKRQPADWAVAVAIDAKLRDGTPRENRAPRDFAGSAYVHAARRPLAEVALRDEDQLSLFGDECQGVCGV